MLALAPVAGAWTWPVEGPVLQPFVFDAATPYAAGEHRGVDIGADAGHAVLAPAAGTVTFAGSVPSSGKSLTITTADGYAVTLTHLGSLAVKQGAAIAEGDAVGTVGPSGDPELSQPYVHLGVRVAADDQGYLDPLSAPACRGAVGGSVREQLAPVAGRAGSGGVGASAGRVRTRRADRPLRAAAPSAGAPPPSRRSVAPAVSAPAVARPAVDSRPAARAAVRRLRPRRRLLACMHPSASFGRSRRLRSPARGAGATGSAVDRPAGRCRRGCPPARVVGHEVVHGRPRSTPRRPSAARLARAAPVAGAARAVGGSGPRPGAPQAALRLARRAEPTAAGLDGSSAAPRHTSRSRRDGAPVPGWLAGSLLCARARRRGELALPPSGDSRGRSYDSRRWQRGGRFWWRRPGRTRRGTGTWGM